MYYNQQPQYQQPMYQRPQYQNPQYQQGYQQPQSGFYPQNPQGFQGAGYYPQQTQPWVHPTMRSAHAMATGIPDDVSSAMTNIDAPYNGQGGYQPQPTYASAYVPPPPPQPVYQNPVQQQIYHNPNPPMNDYQYQKQQRINSGQVFGDAANPLFTYYSVAEQILETAIRTAKQIKPNLLNETAYIRLENMGVKCDWFQRFSTILGLLIHRGVKFQNESPESVIRKHYMLVYIAMLANIAQTVPEIESTIPEATIKQFNEAVRTYNQLQLDVTNYGKQQQEFYRHNKTFETLPPVNSAFLNSLFGEMGNGTNQPSVQPQYQNQQYQQTQVQPQYQNPQQPTYQQPTSNDTSGVGGLNDSDTYTLDPDRTVLDISQYEKDADRCNEYGEVPEDPMPEYADGLSDSHLMLLEWEWAERNKARLMARDRVFAQRRQAKQEVQNASHTQQPANAGGGIEPRSFDNNPHSPNYQPDPLEPERPSRFTTNAQGYPVEDMDYDAKYAQYQKDVAAYINNAKPTPSTTISTTPSAFPSNNWQNNWNGHKQASLPEEDESEFMHVEEEYVSGAGSSGWDEDGDHRDENHQPHLGFSARFDENGDPLDWESLPDDSAYDHDIDSAFDETFDNQNEPTMAVPECINQAYAKAKEMIYGIKPSEEIPFQEHKQESNDMSEQTTELTQAELALQDKADIETSLYKLGDKVDDVIHSSSYNRRIPTAPAFLARKQRLVLVNNGKYTAIITRPVRIQMDMTAHELQWVDEATVANLQNPFNTIGNVQYGGQVLEEAHDNVVDIEALVQRVEKATTSKNPSDQHELEYLLTSTPTVKMKGLTVSTNPEDYISAPIEAIHNAVSGAADVDIDSMLIQYQRLDISPYLVGEEERETLLRIVRAKRSTNIVKRVIEFQDETAIPEREVTRLHDMATQWVQRLINVEYDSRWKLDSFINDYDDLAAAVKEDFGEPGLIRLDDIYVRAVVNTYNSFDKKAIEAIDPTAVESAGLEDNESQCVIGHVESITLLPIYYNDYPVALSGNLGIIDAESLPQLYGMLSRTMSDQECPVAEYKFVTKDNAVFKFFRSVAGDEILIARH